MSRKIHLKFMGLSQRILQKSICRIIPQKMYLKIYYYVSTGNKLNLSRPIRYTEKLQWIKLYGCRPEYSDMVDKYEAKNYVSKIIGEKYIVPTIKVWNSTEDINIDDLPSQFVLKCTHDSGGLVICKDKNKLNYDEAMQKLKRSFARNYYWAGRETPYKTVKPRVIAEQYLSDLGKNGLTDYKVLCFNGEPKLIEVLSGRYEGDLRQDIYDINWEKTPIHQSKYGLKNLKVEIEKPEFLDEMLDLSRRLSSGIPHIRVDWYYTNNQLYFGELTFFDASGFEDYEPDEWNEIIGNWIDLEMKS